MPDLGTVITAIVTPFDERLRVDEEAFVSLLRHLAANGSDGFVVCGTTGEASTLSDEEQIGLVELALSERPDGVAIIAGAGSNDTRHAVHLTERATELGADALLSVNPYYNRPSRRGIVRHYEEIVRATELGADALLSVNPYYNRPSRRGIVRHYEEIVRATDKPMLLYNIPSRTGSDLPNDLLAELAQLDNIVGVKQANHDNLA